MTGGRLGTLTGNTIELSQRSSMTTTSKLFLWNFHNTVSIIFWSFPFLLCAVPHLPSLCKGGGKQGLVWKLNIPRSSRLVQQVNHCVASQLPSGTADKVMKPVFKWIRSKQFLSARRRRNPCWVQHTLSAACPFHWYLCWSGAHQTLWELLGLKWALLQLVTCCVNKRQQGLH